MMRRGQTPRLAKNQLNWIDQTGNAAGSRNKSNSSTRVPCHSRSHAGCATVTTCAMLLSNRVSCAAAVLATLITYVPPRAGRSGARSAMSSPCLCVEGIIESCIAIGMRRLGGARQLSIHLPRRAPCGLRRIRSWPSKLALLIKIITNFISSFVKNSEIWQRDCARRPILRTIANRTGNKMESDWLVVLCGDPSDVVYCRANCKKLPASSTKPCKFRRMFLFL